MPLVQFKAATSTSTTATATFDASPTQDHLLVVALQCQTPVANITPPASFAPDVTDDDDAGVFSIGLYSRVCPAGQSATITFTLSSSVVWSILLYEWAGNVTSSPLDKTNKNDPTGTTQTDIQPGSTGPLSQADEVAFVVAGTSAGNGGTEAIDSGFSVIGSAALSQMVSGHLEVHATTALNPHISWLTGRRANAAIATYKLAPAATAIGKSLDTRWSVRSTLGDTSDQRWAVRSTLGDISDQRWAVRALLADTLDARWAVRALATDTTDLRWPVRTAIADQCDLRWPVRQVVPELVDLRWSLNAIAADTLAMQWGVRTAVAYELDLRSSVTVLAAQLLDLRWTTSALAGDSLTLQWIAEVLAFPDTNPLPILRFHEQPIERFVEQSAARHREPSTLTYQEG